jgi:methyl-accepting chemotaxis protein
MEAARAGEQGSGFGVVAAEVRRLARSSSEAADRTEALLGDLLSRAGVAQESARESLTLARGTRDAVDRSRQGLTGLASEFRPGDEPDGTAEASAASPAAALAAALARMEQLAGDLAALSQGARDTRLAGRARCPAQDLIATASLGRSAARARRPSGAPQNLPSTGVHSGSSHRGTGAP